ncbi:GDP-L-fucose synthase [Olleya sp. YSTF-M6]|uniref:GDP-L-fucose synthase n=1 Tax=Olleya sediminilitoris TaxID=2795739 RepID=A0ABS1WHB2_9FLAO|nr:GDP-L-fucose synthase [Olleya sediminilitoris]MBL7558508.1 GDP-L-fucose synthase [Olleya sediminilitoris]
MHKDAKIYVAGHNGMLGSAIVRALKKEGYHNIVFRRSFELDLKKQEAVNSFFKTEKPEYVFLVAAKVGGIGANIERPAEFLYDNLMINSNIIEAAYQNKVSKLLFLGSSCIYPRLSQQPMKEEYLLDGKLEPTNEGYALGKIAGIKLCEYYNKQYGTNFISAMPPNLYGENDNFDPAHSHVIGALLRKFHTAKINNDSEVVMWGTGSAKREFMYVDDAASACLFLMNNYNENQHINIGSDEDVQILELAEIIKGITGFEGQIVKDTTKPDGMPRKLMDSSKMHELGWKHSVELKEGLEKTFKFFLEQEKQR